MSENIINYYDRITSIFTDTIRNPVDKSIAFRTEFEKFLEYFLNSKSTLNELLKEFYKAHNIREVNDISHTLKNKLNAITHGDFIPKEDDVKIYFETIIKVIFIATKISPPQQVLSILNIDQNELLNNLNEKQKLAVLEDKKIVFVNAGPGTGKTHILVNKIYHHIRQSNAVENIVALSYTNSSAFEVQKRLSEKAFYSNFKEYNMFSGTIHSFAFKTLRSFSKHINSQEYEFSILDDEEIEFFAEEINSILGSKYNTNEILGILKNNNLSSLKSKELIDKVEFIKKKYKLIGFKDILLNFQKAIQTNVEFVDWLKSRVSIILVDEAQDLTKLQYNIFSILLSKLDIKLFLVGDPRQNIFGFNDGSYKHLEDFLHHHQSEFSELVLDTSYRCPESIFETLNKFEFDDCKNYPIKSTVPNGTLRLIGYRDKSFESYLLVKFIKEVGDYKNTAVLFTSLRYFDILAKDLNHADIPFRSVGGRKFLKPYIRLLFHFLNVVQDNSNSFSWRYIYKYFSLPFDNTSEEVDYSNLVKRIRSKHEYAELPNDFFQHVLTNKSPSQVLKYLSKHLKSSIEGINKYYEPAEIEKDLQEFINISESYRNIDEILSSFSLNKDEFKAFFKRDLEIESKFKDLSDAVTLSTIHSAKGLQWKYVYIPGLSDGIFPNPFFCEVENNPTKTRENYNDDFKKLYVAMSRTLDTLILTYPYRHDNKYGKTFYLDKSRFLKKLGLESMK